MNKIKNNFSLSILLLIVILSLIIITLILFNLRGSKTTTQELSIKAALTLTPTFLIPTTPREEAKVAFVFDGDTIELPNGQKVRLLGIDAPELNECLASQSAKILKELIKDQVVEMEKDREDKDQYDRLLRYIWVEDVFVNEFMIKQGFAKTLLIPPNLRYSDLLKKTEKEARKNKRGMWGECY